MATRNVKPFNTETSYLLWDDEHDAAGVTFVREDAKSVVFDYNGTELDFEQATVVNLGSAHPPAPAAREAGKHYISTDDSGASNEERSLPPEESWNSDNSQASQGTGQSGGRRKGKRKGKKTKKARKSRKSKSKTKKSKK